MLDFPGLAPAHLGSQPPWRSPPCPEPWLRTSRARSLPRCPLPCLLHVSLGLLARGLEPEVAGEVACVISGRWPPAPHPSGSGGRGHVRLLRGVPGTTGPPPAPASPPTPGSSGPPSLRADAGAAAAPGPSGHQGAPTRPARGWGCFLQRASTRAAGVAFQNVPWSGRFTKNKKTFFM